MNMMIGFSVATKHRLRFEPGYDYPDLRPYIQNLSTFAKSAYETDGPIPVKKCSSFRLAGQWLGLPGFQIDPAKAFRKGPKYHGNLPLEILTYISSYLNICITNGSMTMVPVEIQVMTAVQSLLECLTGMERILATPIPLAYNIAITHIAWLYILILPFQLVDLMGWVAIPATIGISQTTPRLIGSCGVYYSGAFGDWERTRRSVWNGR
jgi:putative membrane protein